MELSHVKMQEQHVKDGHENCIKWRYFLELGKVSNKTSTNVYKVFSSLRDC